MGFQQGLHQDRLVLTAISLVSALKMDFPAAVVTTPTNLTAYIEDGEAYEIEMYKKYKVGFMLSSQAVISYIITYIMLWSLY
ncbi:hypothetical protein V2J09_008605 [Rumex salicifolius]